MVDEWRTGHTLMSRTLIIVAVLLVGGISLSCGEPLTQPSYRGEPLFRFTGQVAAQGVFSQAQRIRLSIFWLPSGGKTVQTEWVEQASASVDISFPSEFEVKVFQRPDPNVFFVDQALGRLMLYDDLNGNNRRDADEPFVGSAPNQGIVYTDRPLDYLDNQTGVSLPGGFTLIHYPLRCRSRLDRSRDVRCLVPIGSPCETSDDCCPDGVDCTRLGAACLRDLVGQYPFPGGYCTARGVERACPGEWEDETAGVASRPVRFSLLQRDAEVVLKACRSNDECRSGYVCEPAYQVCLPERPVLLRMRQDYEIEEICEPRDQTIPVGMDD